ncbi:MAG: peptidoglycan editing factor PgeF [Eubacteriales bacterium]|nr:peptidoglycan editing factor PgeF [Eubacteriales bacterium]
MSNFQKIQLQRKGTGEVLKVNEKNGVPYLTFPMLSALPGVLHGFSTREGGVSRDHLSTMNLSFSRGDEEENVRENYRRIAAAIGFSTEDMVFSDQTHTTNVRLVTREDCGKGWNRERDYSDVDGLITEDPEVVLCTFFADCVPLFFVDPVRHAIGLTHSGWRGTVGKIGKRTVERMQECFGSRPEDLYAAIGPSICQDCYQVSEDVIDEFRANFAPKHHAELFRADTEEGKYRLNLWRANELIFEEAGIKKDHIQVTDLCTCCNPQFLYSHRASNGRRGNLAAFLTQK